MTINELFRGQPIAPIIEPNKLTFGEVILIHKTQDQLSGPTDVNIGVFLGKTAHGAEIFVDSITEWRRYESNELCGKTLAVKTCFSQIKDEAAGEFIRGWIYRHLGTTQAFTLPPGFSP